MHLVIDIGNSRLKGGVFENGSLIDAFFLPVHPLPVEQLQEHLEKRAIKEVFIASVNSKADQVILKMLDSKKIRYAMLDYSKLRLQLDVDEPDALGPDRIANAYGALTRFPINDCIVVDIGTAITYDFIAKEGRYLGGLIYPGAELCAKALNAYTDKLPLVTPKKLSSPLGKTTETHLQGGIYFGQLGAIERTLSELRQATISPSSIKVIATGGATREEHREFVEDLKELVDCIDPNLTLIGLHEILIERLQS
jgi:type III pantothenate kinase